ncbi:hypothetical protein EC991_009153 [Linnemannia zychae]|nr:hypothetical protein EC991_009153 [Linnemannia zychae]
MTDEVIDLRILHPEERIQLVESITSVNPYAHRFYAQPNSSKVIYGVRSPTPPTTITSKEAWSCLVPIGAIEPGYYWITLGISYQGSAPPSLKAFSAYGRISRTNIDNTELSQVAGSVLDDSQIKELGETSIVIVTVDPLVELTNISLLSKY